MLLQKDVKDYLDNLRRKFYLMVEKKEIKKDRLGLPSMKGNQI